MRNPRDTGVQDRKLFTVKALTGLSGNLQHAVPPVACRRRQRGRSSAEHKRQKNRCVTCVNSRWDRPKADVLPDESRGSVSSPTDASGAPQGGVEMAAAMAAKINAMLMAKGKLKPLQPLPSKAPPALPVAADELIVAEVDINDVPMECRELLTKGKTQDEIGQLSGAVVSTKGLYMSDTDSSAGAIKEIISEDVLRSSGGQQPAVMPTVPVYRQTVPSAARAPAVPGHKPAPPHTGSFVHTKIFVGLEQSQPSFNVRERVEGPSGSYLQHIQSETGARVFLRGRGSGYIEQASRRESFEPLYLYISYGGQSWYGYPSSYPTYPAAFWNSSSGATGQSQPSSGAVQYPVCKQSGFLLQDIDAAASSSNQKETERRDLQQSSHTHRSEVKNELMKSLISAAEEQLMMKKMKIPEDSSSSSGLVPYGGDSSDEEEERMRSGNKS
ncbi:hypothetical protein cypCar_00021470 [Cyprinus carpio]|nr:hypothetical protein cypCar_00021470 [Cyprinus carpio]